MWDSAGEMSALEEVVAQLLVRQPAPLLRPLHLQVTVALAPCVCACSAAAGAPACSFNFHPPRPWAITLDAWSPYDIMDTNPGNYRVQALWWAADRAHRAVLAGPQAAIQTLTQNPSDGRADAEAGAREAAAGASSGPDADPNPGPMEGPLRELRGALELLAMVAAKRPETVGDRLSLLLKVRPAVGRMRGSPPATSQCRNLCVA